MRSTFRQRALGASALVLLAAAALPAIAQPAPANTAWYGMRQPLGFSDPFQPVIPFSNLSIGTVPASKTFPAASPLSGDRILADVKTIIDIGRETRKTDAMWGRISGQPGLLNTVKWSAAEMKKAGIANVEVQEWTLERPQWMPKKWEVKLHANPAYGAGSQDIVLASAFPQTGAKTTAQPLTAPVVFVGSGTEVNYAGKDVKGKIALIHVMPRPALLYSESVGAADYAIKQGAVAAINIIESPGNMHYVDGRFGCGQGPCFSVGGQDGMFLEQLVGKAATAGAPTPQITLSLESELPAGQRTGNAVGVIKGKSDKVILVIAHADGYWDGAGDNADGLAVMMSMVRHFAAKGQPNHTLVFVASAGHHGPGNGPNAFMKMNPELHKNTVLVLNLEHISQVDVVTQAQREPVLPGYFTPIPSTVEMAKKAGVSNQSPFLVDLLHRKTREFGISTSQIVGSGANGEGGGFARAGKPVVTLIGSGVFYHSSGDVYANISKNGLERGAGFYAAYIEEADKATDDKFGPGPNAPPARDPSLMAIKK